MSRSHLPTRAELAAEYPDNFDVRAACEASAWTFVFGARHRGWTVSDPTPGANGTVHFVTVWAVGTHDGGSSLIIRGQVR